MKQKSKNRWKRTFSMCLAFQMAVTTPAAGVTLPVGDQGSKINTGRYAAVFDPVSGGGSLALFQGSSPDQAWNTMDEALIPGTTMLWDGRQRDLRKLQITPETVLSAGVKYRCGNGNPAGQ